VMGGKTPEICWAVNKIRLINWKIVASGWWFIWIVRWCTDLQTLKKAYNCLMLNLLVRRLTIKL
jgi:hypothetical protein